jgi:pimeloyl-ACP methyl ester carboxylesterase
MAKTTTRSLVLAGGVMTMMGIGLAAAAYVRRYVSHSVSMRRALNAELKQFTSKRAGRVAYYVAGQSRRGLFQTDVAPLFVIHSVNAAASSYEMKPIIDEYARTRRVISIELPGFGFSDRARIEYSPDLYRDVILELMGHECGAVAADVVALSLGSEFATLAALAQPQRFRTLTLISPSGMSQRTGMSLPLNGALRVLDMPQLSQALFDLLVSRPSLEKFLRASLRRADPQPLADYAYETSHQVGARNAPFYFIAGKLFTPNMVSRYAQLKLPVLALCGHDYTTRYDAIDKLKKSPNWQIVDLPQYGGLVHWDDPRLVFTHLERHFKTI